MEILKPNKKILVILSILVVGIILMTLINLLSPNQIQTPAPSPFPKKSTAASPLITNNFPSAQPQAKSAYDSNDLEKDYQRIESKKPLKNTDQTVRNQLITSLNNQSGYLEQNANFKIEYVKAPNLFMIEILSEDADVVKKEALNWFLNKGFSPKGVCNLPVLIYLNYSTERSLAEKDITFDPIPEDCK